MENIQLPHGYGGRALEPVPAHGLAEPVDACRRSGLNLAGDLELLRSEWRLPLEFAQEGFDALRAGLAPVGFGMCGGELQGFDQRHPFDRALQ